jgi:hydrogenase maturation protease
MGNIMFCDEGLGTYLAKYIEANYKIPNNLEIVDGGLMGFGLMSYYQEFDKLIIISTNSKEANAGEIFNYSADEMLKMGQIRQTANEVEVAMMIEICSVKEDMADIEFITMTPKNIEDVKNDLSNTVLENMPKLLEKTLQVLKKEGIDLKLKESIKSFKEIVQEVANPVNDRVF